MIQSLKLRNFRNLSEREFFFSGEKIIISGDNGHGKTNLLEAIGLIGGENLTALDFDNLVTKGNTNFFIECQSDGDKLAIAYEMNGKKKQYSINGKKTSKTKFLEHSYETISFSPMEMNTLFLGPSLRRDFLDKILRKAFPQYEKLLKNYKNIVRNRNLTLKNIQK
ncbi:MAG: AAA family ATPase [Candidatus Peribacteria bacterium]|nr:MAG: AAA family ATPase [Candidatus Peribacteria bacterium]